MHQFKKLFDERFNSPLDTKGDLSFLPKEIGLEHWLKKSLQVFYTVDFMNEYEIFIPSISDPRIDLAYRGIHSKFLNMKHKISEFSKVSGNTLTINHGDAIKDFMMNKFKAMIEPELISYSTQIKSKSDFRFEFNSEIWSNHLLSNEQIKKYRFSKREQKLKKLI
jgi:hypothetical protein